MAVLVLEHIGKIQRVNEALNIVVSYLMFDSISNIFYDRSVEKNGILRYVTDDFTERGFWDVGDGNIVNVDRAGGGLIEIKKHLEESRLSAADFTDDSNAFIIVKSDG